MKKNILIIAFALLLQNITAQNQGDFRSRASGLWGSSSSWEIFDNGNWTNAATPPASNVSITILSNHIISNGNITRTVNNPLTVNGELNIDQGTITFSNTAQVNVFGVLKQTANITNNGNITIKADGKYQYNRTNLNGIPNIVWEDESTCEITGTLGTTVGKLNGLNQNFYHFTINAPLGADHRADGDLQNIRGNFKIIETGSKEFRLTNTISYVLNIHGNLIIEGGTLNLGSGFSGSRTINIGQNFEYSAGNLKNDNTNAKIAFVGNNCQYYNTNLASTLQNISWEIPQNAKLSLQNSFLIATNNILNIYGTIDCNSSYITGQGSVTLHTGATYMSKISGGVSVSGTLNFQEGTNYVFNGSTPQLTGNFLPLNINNLTIDNSHPSGVNMFTDLYVHGVLNLTNGTLNTNNKQLTIVNTDENAIINHGTTSFVNGILRRKINSNLSQGNYIFPIGKSTTYLPASLSNIETGNQSVIISAEAFTTGSNGTAGTGVSSLASTEHWNLQIISGDFINSKISLNRQTPLGIYNIIARSETKTGVYSSLNGIADTQSITNSDNTGNQLGFFAFGRKSNSVDIASFDLVNKIQVYPNPVSNYIKINTTLEYNMLQIIDSKGKTITQHSQNQCIDNTINTEHLSSGLYILRIIFKDKNSQEVKFIKQ